MLIGGNFFISTNINEFLTLVQGKNVITCVSHIYYQKTLNSNKIKSPKTAYPIMCLSKPHKISVIIIAVKHTRGMYFNKSLIILFLPFQFIFFSPLTLLASAVFTFAFWFRHAWSPFLATMQLADEPSHISAHHLIAQRLW